MGSLQRCSGAALGRRLVVLGLLLGLAGVAGCGEKAEPVRAPGLSVGITEFNPNLFWSAAARPDLPDGFGPWRDRLAAIRPAHYRLVVNWSAVQPDPQAPPDWAVPETGCLRTTPPCAPYAGVRDRLRAVRSQQLAGGGWDVLVVLTYAPAWATQIVPGCRSERTDPRQRPIAPAALPAYRRLIASLAELGRREGVALRWWSPWNEPNGGPFLAPQRQRCSGDAPSLAAGLYTPQARAMRAELAAQPGEQRLVLGELAAVDRPRPNSTEVTTFIDGLPDDVVCAADVWGQHVYVGDPDVVAAVERALDSRGCDNGPVAVWVTETGAGGEPPGRPRPSGPAALRAQCRAQQRLLLRWHADPRVEAAFQYSFREDSLFPVGLADAPLTRSYPTDALWRAWGGGRVAAAAPPPLPRECMG